MADELPVIGLIPAAGVAARMGALPCSKELLPVGFMASPGGPRPKPVCLYTLERMRAAGIERAHIVLRPGKWDIPAYLGHGGQLGMRLSYLIMDLPHGSPYTLDQAYPFVRGCLVALGLPDIIFEPADAYAQLIARQRATGADVVLGLFPCETPQTADMVAVGAGGRVERIEIKPARSALRHSWMVAVWGPRFTEQLHGHLAEVERLRAGGDAAARPAREVFVGDVIVAAIAAGLHVEAVTFAEGHALDVGTPASLARAVRRYAAEADEA